MGHELVAALAPDREIADRQGTAELHQPALAQKVGGLGLAPGLCVGERLAMSQATHGSAPDIAGKNIANPYALIMSGQMLFEWLGRKRNEPKATQAAKLGPEPKMPTGPIMFFGLIVPSTIRCSEM